MENLTITNSVSGLWNRLPLIIRAVLTGCLVSSAGVFVWGGMLSAFPRVWVILPMMIVLWMYWKFFSGGWGNAAPVKTGEAYFRLSTLKPGVFKWGLAAAILFVIIVQSSFVITFRLIDFPAAKFTADYKLLETFSLWAAWAMIIMGSIVAGVCEETGFRGYMQVPLEKKYGPVTSIALTSVVFTLIHLGHTWAYPILPHIFFASALLGILAFTSGSIIPGIVGHIILDIFDYAVWWTNLTGGFHEQTIYRTGIDFHFVVWVLIFLAAVYGFFRITGKLKTNPPGTAAVT